jgi:hypothetical protein
MMKTKTSSCTTSIKDSTSNGMSFMPMNTQKSQSKVNSMNNTVCTLREISTLSHK